MFLLIFAHPYPQRSRANARLLQAVRDLPDLELCDLYSRYPDFDIDVAAEQAALVEADVVIWQHPLHWYSVPSLLKHWIDKVLLRGFAYGDGGTALHDKGCLWVTTTGGDEHAFSETGMHHRPFREYVPVIEQTARFCGMQWLEPFVVHAAHRISGTELDRTAERYRQHLLDIRESWVGATAAKADAEVSP